MCILIGADLVPTKSNFELFSNGNTDALLGDKLGFCLRAAEFRIFNLEVPLTDVPTPIAKCGPNLIAPTNTVKAYKAMGVDLLTLANNHAFDQGLQGMLSTCRVLQNQDIAYIGVGENSTDASKPHLFEIAGKKIGVYACCEHEFGVASEHCAGANGFDAFDSVDHIVTLKKQCDCVIVLYHGGKEHYRYPSPMLQRICRKLVEKGADLVVCQHSHCIGCEEKYLGSTIVYGQGNFLFDYSDNECWETSLLLSLDENLNVTYLPLVKCGNTVRLAEGEAAARILNGFTGRSEEIKQDGFIERKYKEFADSMLNGYLFALSGVKRTFAYKVLDKLTGHRFTAWLLNRKYNREKKLAIRNFVECEAHRELLLSGLNKSNV